MNSLMVDLAQVKANYDRERERETGTAPMNVSVPLDIIALKKEVKKSEFIHSSLMDTQDGAYVWEYSQEDCPDSIVQLYLGDIKVLSNSSSSYVGGLAIVEGSEKDQVAGLELTESFLHSSGGGDANVFLAGHLSGGSLIQGIPSWYGVPGPMCFGLLQREPKLHCRVRWEPNTLTLWDNRCTQHHSVWDYYPFSRYGERVSVLGDSAPGPAVAGA